MLIKSVHSPSNRQPLSPENTGQYACVQIPGAAENFPTIVLDNGRIYQEVMNTKQVRFHEGVSKFRWLGGGVGGGKSVAALVEALKHSWNYENNYGFILRKTFPEIRLSAFKDFRTICPDWMIFADNKNEHWIDVLNYKGYVYLYQQGGRKHPKRVQSQNLRRIHGLSRIEFISFEGTLEAESKFRSANIGWYFIEQAESASIYVYNALNQRLRRQPSARQAWFVSNPDGRDWLWHIFHSDSPHKRANHTHIPVELSDNTALTPDYHQNLKDTYSEEEYQRFVKGSHDVAVDAVFPEFSYQHHVIDHFDPPSHWRKGVGLDPGISNPTAFVLAAKFPPPHEDVIYIYHEYQESDRVVSDHVKALKPLLNDYFECFAIDPDAKKRDAVHAQTVLGEYNLLGIPFQISSRDIVAGVNRMKEYLKYDALKRHPVTDRMGTARLLVSSRCPMLVEQLLDYRKKEQKTGRGFSNPPEGFRDYKDHLVAATRYLFVKFTTALSVKSYIKGFEQPSRQSFISRRNTRKNPELKAYYEVYNENGDFTIEKLVADAERVPKCQRRTTWVSA